MENSVLKLSMENEKLKGEVEQYKLKIDDLERENGGMRMELGRGGHEDETGTKKNKKKKTKEEDLAYIPNKTNTRDGT